MASYRRAIKHGNVRWVVEYGKINNVRQTATFKTESEAKAELTKHKKDRNELGKAWLNIEPRRRYEILKILSEIKDRNTNLSEVWDFYKSNCDRKAGVTVSEAIAEMMKQKEAAGRRSLYLRELRYGLLQFEKAHGDDDIANVRDSTILLWLDKRKGSQSTRATLQRRLSTLFSWAVKRKYVKDNPVLLLEKVSITKADPQILAVDQCKRLVQCAIQMDKGIAKYFALSLFLGIRPEECQRLTNESIDLEKRTVTVSGDAAKTRNRRIVTINDPALRILVNTLHADYKVNFRKRLVAVRKESEIKKWPKDVLRHIAASHFHNIYTMDEATKQLGHSADVMLQHYRQLVTKEETQEWLKIL